MLSPGSVDDLPTNLVAQAEQDRHEELEEAAALAPRLWQCMAREGGHILEDDVKGPVKSDEVQETNGSKVRVSSV